MTYDELASLIASRASNRLYDTAIGRAFFRAIGVDVREPMRNGVIVHADRYADVGECMGQRYGVSL